MAEFVNTFFLKPWTPPRPCVELPARVLVLFTVAVAIAVWLRAGATGAGVLLLLG